MLFKYKHNYTYFFIKIITIFFKKTFIFKKDQSHHLINNTKNVMIWSLERYFINCRSWQKRHVERKSNYLSDHLIRKLSSITGVCSNLWWERGEVNHVIHQERWWMTDCSASGNETPGNMRSLANFLLRAYRLAHSSKLHI